MEEEYLAIAREMYSYVTGETVLPRIICVELNKVSNLCRAVDEELKSKQVIASIIMNHLEL